MKKISSKKILAVLCLVGSLIWLVVLSFPDSKLHLIFCDVGEGDAILITKGFNQILIDGGPNNKVLNCLKKNMPFFDKKIEIVAVTHPEADHMTGIIPVIEKYQIGWFLIGPEGNDSAIYAALISKLKTQSASWRTNPNLKSKKTNVVNPYLGDEIRLGAITLKILWPERKWVAEQLEKESGNSTFVLGAKTTNSKLNDFSLVFLLEYQGKKALLMGDADSRVQDEIMEGNTLPSVEILKFPHHGSKTGITKEFLEKIRPKISVISVGKNSYGHPTSEALDLLKNSGVQIRRTDLEGEIKFNF